MQDATPSTTFYIDSGFRNDYKPNNNNSNLRNMAEQMVTVLDRENTLLNRFIAQMRDVHVQGDSMRFRRNLERAGEVMAYEISKTLEYKPKLIETPLGEAEVMMPDDEIVIATILRAGLPFHQGFLNYFDNAQNAFVSAYRKYRKDNSFNIKVEYISACELTGKTLIISDPMLATGGSAIDAITMIKKHGGRNIKFMCIIAAPEGVKALHEAHPDVQIYIGHLDRCLNEHAYICPGLGDAGDRIFGTK